MARGQGGTLSGFTPLSTPNAPTDLSVSTSIGSASVSFAAPTDTGDGAVTSFIVTAIDESTGIASGATGSASPITVSPGSGTFKIRAQAVNDFGPGRLTEFDTGNEIYSGAELYAWGRNFNGQLGDGTAVNKSSPVQVGALTNWAQVSAGTSFSACVTTAGTLFTWGNGGEGQLGDGTAISKSSPVQVGALTNWVQVSAGGDHTACVKTDGTLWTWGSNSNGQLGHNNTTNLSSPVQVGALTDWAQVAANLIHTACVKTDGTLWLWGENDNGQLGDGTVVRKSSPVQIGALTNWTQVSTGGAGPTSHTACVKTDGTLFTWGRNNYGQLGHNNTINRSSPVQVGALTNWAQVSIKLGTTTGCVKTDGTLFTWGFGGGGRLGHNNQISLSSPVQVGALTNWAQFSTGPDFSTCVTTAGTLFTWGYNTNGNLGQGNTINRSSPVQVGALTDWVQVAAGGTFTTALFGVL